MTGEKKTVAIVQARMSSSRLPGKVLEPLNDMPLIIFMLERLKKCTKVDHICLATSEEESDGKLAAAVEKAGFSVFRGSLNDVLDRFYTVAKKYRADFVVRLTGDCPLIDHDLVDRLIADIEDGEFDYISNIDPPTFPDGLDCEVVTMEALTRAFNESELKSDREHVTPYIRKDGNGFRMKNVLSAVDLSDHRWTVDYPDDLDRIRKMVSLLGEQALDADRYDYLRASEKLQLHDERHSAMRNEGLLKSISED